MRLMIWLPVGMVILILIVIGWQFRTPETSASVKLETKPLVARKKDVLKVPADLSWSSLSDKELREFTSHFENAKAPNSCSLETLVKPGETIVTEAYEGKPGEFVFSKLTPSIQTRSDGTNVVEVNVNSFGLNVSGEQHDIVSHVLEVAPRSHHSIITRLNDATYDIDVSAVVEGNPPMIKMKVNGEYQKRPPLK